MQRDKIVWPPGLLEREKRDNKVVSFSILFLIFTLTWITEKELGRQKSSSLEEKHENFIVALLGLCV